MFLGIDIGTSEVKALLLDEGHRVIAVAGEKLDVARPAPGWSEQAPADWWAGTQAALARLRTQAPQAYAGTAAIGLSGQMHGAVLLDRDDRVLRPAILWNDTRSAAQCTALMADCPDWPQVAGSLVMPGFTAPKLRWVAENEPAIFERVAKVLLPKDHVRLQLTGEHVTDLSDASGTAWLDVDRRDWAPRLLAACGLDAGQMPRLVEGSAVGGVLSAHAAARLGLNPGIPVAGGAGDNAASAIGMGNVDAGQGFLSLGTSGVIFVVTPAYQPNVGGATHAFCHALPGRWHQMSVMLSAASCLQWLTQLLGAASEAALETEAGALDPSQRAGAPLFLPYLGGERTPHNDAALRGSFHGLGHATDRARLAYAVMEGVSFGLADGWQALHTAGSRVRQLSLVGGGARSGLWAQQLASLLDIEIVVHADAAAGGALGAARLAWLAHGGSLAEVCVAPPIRQAYAPDAAEAAMLAPRQARFRSLYPAPAAPAASA